MGCPDRKRDRMILAEVERRKVMEPAEPVRMTWEGSLAEFLVSGISEDNILKIERVGDGWFIDLKE